MDPKSVFSVSVRKPNCLFSEPFFVQLDVVPESINNLDGDDDKVYMFFSEEAMEFDLPAQIRVSRVARVCKVQNVYVCSSVLIPDTMVDTDTCLPLCGWCAGGFGWSEDLTAKVDVLPEGPS